MQETQIKTKIKEGDELFSQQKTKWVSGSLRKFNNSFHVQNRYYSEIDGQLLSAFSEIVRRSKIGETIGNDEETFPDVEICWL